MPDTEIPPATHYQFVCRRYDWAPHLPWLEATYEETVEAKPVELDGVVAATLFIRRKEMLERAIALGWKDETEKWNAKQSKKAEEVSITNTDERPKRRRTKRTK